MRGAAGNGGAYRDGLGAEGCSLLNLALSPKWTVDLIETAVRHTPQLELKLKLTV